MKRTVVVVAALAALLAVLVGASLVAAAPSPQQSPTQNGKGATSENFPQDFNIGPDCFGEEIKVTGTEHVVDHFVPVNGGWRINSHINFMNMKGVGLMTGDQYVLNAESNSVENFVPTHGGVASFVNILMVVSKGSVTNQNGLLVVHYTINEDGTLASSVDHSHLKCTGPGGPTSPTASASASATATPTAAAKAQSRP